MLRLTHLLFERNERLDYINFYLKVFVIMGTKKK